MMTSNAATSMSGPSSVTMQYVIGHGQVKTGRRPYPELNNHTSLLLHEHLSISQLPQLDLVVGVGVRQLLLRLPDLRMLHAQLPLLLPGIGELGVCVALCICHTRSHSASDPVTQLALLLPRMHRYGKCIALPFHFGPYVQFKI